ncbi:MULTISPECIES: LysR family transcriptional regulator [Rhodococcus]|uniref:LysR family transcriptional regulator n=1 Tax=Rhodococcus TaxID=1827 RepID=UPI0022860AC2|nr:LysR family transcriptional regulator [Rhodococcus sp. JS3073]WAM19917.1 LysR family transcriptional regulator [Rhodococcus sp. JS3073]
MAELEQQICKKVKMASSRPSADDLLVLLEVARSGRFNRAAETLGINHVTISRRISALERTMGGKLLARSNGGWELTPLGKRALTAAERLEGVLQELESSPETEPVIEDVVRLSATDAFSTFVAAPAAARLHQRHPGISVEIVSTTRRAVQHRSGLEIEIVVGEPQVVRAEAFRLGSYVLGLFASTDYLRRHDPPTTVDDLTLHRLVYFISSMLQVDDLDVGRRYLPDMRDSVTSTNVFAHVEATRAGAGLGLLPTFMAARRHDLIRILPNEIAVQMDYWLVARSDTLRRPAVAAVVRELRITMRQMEDVLLGSDGPPPSSEEP